MVQYELFLARRTGVDLTHVSPNGARAGREGGILGLRRQES
jgi:hypothetical protein